MAPRMVNPFQRFPFTCPDPSEESLIYGSCCLTKCASWIVRLESQNGSLIHGLQNGFCIAGLADRKTTLTSLCVPIRAPGRPGALSMSSNIFFWAVGLGSGLKALSKPGCKLTCCHPGFVVPSRQHGESRLSIILQDLRIWGMLNECWLQLKATSSISSQQEDWAVLWSFEARHCLLSSYGSPRWHLLPI